MRHLDILVRAATSSSFTTRVLFHYYSTLERVLFSTMKSTKCTILLDNWIHWTNVKFYCCRVLFTWFCTLNNINTVLFDEYSSTLWQPYYTPWYALPVNFSIVLPYLPPWTFYFEYCTCVVAPNCLLFRGL